MTDDKYFIEDIYVESKESRFPDEPDVNIIFILFVVKQVVRNGIKLEEKDIRVFTLSLIEVNEKDLEDIKNFIVKEEDIGLAILEFKRNTKSYKYRILKLNRDGNIVNELSLNYSGVCKIEKLDWDDKKNTNWIKQLFKK